MEREKRHSLVVGHPLVVNSNRKFWSVFARSNSVDLDLVCPQIWESNLIKKLKYSFDPATDFGLKNIFPVNCFFKGNGSLFFFNPWKLWKILRFRYDDIFINQEGWSFAFTFLRILIYFSRNKNSAIYITAAQNIKKEKWSWMHGFERWNTRSLNSIFYCSEGVREILEWKKLPTKYYYLPLSFDEDFYSVYLTRDLSILDGEGLGRSKVLRIGYLGRISEDKGVLILLSAVKKLRDQGFSIELIVAGAGPLEKVIQAEASEYLGVIPHQDAYQFYGKIDLFILPSLTFPHWKEQFGRVLVEAAAAGNIVVASNSGSIPEVLSKLEQPFIFEENSADSLCGEIKKVLKLSEEKKLSKLVHNSQQKSFALFSHCSVSQYLYKIWELEDK